MKYVSNADCNYTTSYARFKSQNYFEWFNPQNWKHSSGIAVPHAFQVPCRYDHAIFEPKLAFKVSITQPVDISLLTINDLSIGKQDKIYLSFFSDIDMSHRAGTCHLMEEIIGFAFSRCSLNA